MCVTGVTLHGHLTIRDRTFTVFLTVYVIFFLKRRPCPDLSLPPAAAGPGPAKAALTATRNTVKRV